MNVTIKLLSNALRTTTPFVTGVQRLFELKNQHHRLHKEGNVTEAQEVRRAFQKNMEQFRPLFTAVSSFEVAKFYSIRLFRTLQYFNFVDDPLYRQLEVVLGKMALKRKSDASLKTSYSSQAYAALYSLREQTPSFLPAELPAPPEEVYSGRNHQLAQALDFPDRHRGHWILRDPEIAITKEERRTDPW